MLHFQSQIRLLIFGDVYKSFLQKWIHYLLGLSVRPLPLHWTNVVRWCRSTDLRGTTITSSPRHCGTVFHLYTSFTLWRSLRRGLSLPVLLWRIEERSGSLNWSKRVPGLGWSYANCTFRLYRSDVPSRGTSITRLILSPLFA